ncbi:unnamed protein product [Prorocentrum cordatum]|uniref:Uncharacterized protein n=1 Tax=Prorocentrum cordatum TaxID=2364126 RepID=A0ABN9WAY7_9DINO|nr:unnamed protein product [Polarella glacialis]CAK0882872.1 unnamed protein product [Polarella glacialis]
MQGKALQVVTMTRGQSMLARLRTSPTGPKDATEYLEKYSKSEKHRDVPAGFWKEFEAIAAELRPGQVGDAIADGESVAKPAAGQANGGGGGGGKRSGSVAPSSFHAPDVKKQAVGAAATTESKVTAVKAGALSEAAASSKAGAPKRGAASAGGAKPAGLKRARR